MALCRCLCPFAAIRKQLLDYKFKTFASQVLAPISSCRTEIARVSQKATLRDSIHSCFQRGSLNPRFDVSAKLISTTSGFFTEYEIVNTPPFAESITEGDVRWEKGIGDKVAEDEVVGEIETDKTSIPITASAPGVIVELFVEDGGMVEKGDKLFKIQVGAGVSDVEPKAEPDITIAAAHAGGKETEPSISVELSSSSIPLPVEEKPLGPIKVVKPSQLPSPPSTQQQLDIMQSESKEAPTELTGSRRETRVKMSRMRQRIALRLKDAQNMNAMLTTFNEVDMRNLNNHPPFFIYNLPECNIMEMRKQHKDSFLKTYGLKLGFMSAFTKACSYALNSMPVVNAVIEDGYVIYRDYVDISVAVATPKGLVVPVLRDVQSMDYLEIEKGINDLGKKARNGELAIEDMDGGTFTISNGGVFGSLMGTPIINPPQSAILGLHSINDRPVAINGQVVIRPMMYVALTYDHRLIDGREAVTFLRKVKAAVEDPRIILLNL